MTITYATIADVPTDSVGFMVRDVLGLITDDDLGWVPHFALLHDHVDANMYAVEAIDAAKANDLALTALMENHDQWLALCNRIEVEVDAALPVVGFALVTDAIECHLLAQLEEVPEEVADFVTDNDEAMALAADLLRSTREVIIRHLAAWTTAHDIATKANTPDPIAIAHLTTNPTTK